MRAWIARDADGILNVYYYKKPQKDGRTWWNNVNVSDVPPFYEEMPSDLFPQIKWEDDEPMEVTVDINPIGFMVQSKIEALEKLKSEMRVKLERILPIIRSYNLKEFADVSNFEADEFQLCNVVNEKTQSTYLAFHAERRIYEVCIPASYISMTEPELCAVLSEKKRIEEEEVRRVAERVAKEKEEAERQEYERLKAKFG